jgi:hypothetical protein
MVAPSPVRCSLNWIPAALFLRSLLGTPVDVKALAKTAKRRAA